MILVGITPTRPPQHGNPDLPQSLDHIHPDMIPRPKSIIDTPSQIFGEMAVNIPANGWPGSVPDRQTYRRLRKNTGRKNSYKTKGEKKLGAHMI
jgi:hypothetical protein